MTAITHTPTDYQTAIEHVAFSDESNTGRILMRGRDRAALLQRLTTNDIERLRSGQGSRTVLTTPIGRIIDLLTIHALDESFLVVTSPGQGPVVFSHLKKNIFFNDQVTLEPAGRAYVQIALYGPQAQPALEEIAQAPLPQLALSHTATLTIAGAEVRIARRPPIGGDGLTLYIPADAAEAVRTALETSGAVALTPESLELLRIEAGIPSFGHELGQEYIPLETGLLDAISFTKGCYVGQEIIARMESRGRLAKQLRGLRLSEPAEAPAKLDVGGKEAGDLTSTTVSPRYGSIALAYVRSAHADAGTIVGIAGSTITGEVVELPFR
jgi:folate-binding protein YgfZ